MGKFEIPTFLDPEISWFLIPMGFFVSFISCLAICGGWPSPIKHPVDDTQRPLFLLRHSGTFESFLYPDPSTRRTASARTLQVDYTPNRAYVYGHILMTAFAKVLKIGALFGLFSLGMAWSLVNGVHYGKVELLSVLKSMEASALLLQILIPLTSCMLVFYIILRLQRFSHTVRDIHRVSGTLEEIALVVGCALKEHKEDEGTIKALWVLYRLLNVVHVLIYLKISIRFEHHCIRDLLLAGYVTEAECAALTGSPDPTGLATFWIGHWLSELHKNEVFDINLLTQMMKSVSELRSAVAQLLQEVDRKAPMSFAQLMQIAIDVVCLLSTPVILHRFLVGSHDQANYVFIGGTSTLTSTTTTTTTTTSTQEGIAAHSMMFDHSRVSIYVLPMLCSTFVTFIYQGSLQLVKDLEDPFAIGLDSLNPDVVLDITERRVSSFLRRKSEIAAKQLRGTLRSVRRQAAEVMTSAEQIQFELVETESFEILRESTGRESTQSLTIIDVDDDAAGIAPDENRQWLPTAVVLCDQTMRHLKEGAHQDSKDLNRGVHRKLEKLEEDMLQKIEDDDPYLLAVEELIPKLQEESLTNAHMREQVVKAIAGLSQRQHQVLQNPTPRRRSRSVVQSRKLSRRMAPILESD